MCGICGFYGFEDRKLLKRMSSVIVNRGPDDEGYYSDGLCSLGMRRLAIIDVEKGKQPVHNENRDVWVVFNGEIYNYKQLRAGLKGHRFYTDSDTEALVHAYEEFGDGFVSRLNGMFAFAIWDSRMKRLLLARDRFGEKPLYYSVLGKRLVFGSEIKCILQCPEIRRVVNFSALDEYLSFRCNSSSETFFRGVFRLPPAHCLSYDGRSLSVWRYWSPSVIPDYSRSESSFADELFARLRESVRMRMMSEVPLGAYLSGGIDSGSVVGLMSSLSDEPVKTFSVGFEHNFDELEDAALLASHFRTAHREIRVKADAVDLLPDIVWHLDEPMADPTCIPVYLLSREVKPFATVVLTGDGSDELFYGYEQFRFLSMHMRYVQRLPSAVRGIVPFLAGSLPRGVLDRFFRYSSSLGSKGVYRLRSFVSSDDPVQMYLSLVSVFDEAEKSQLLSGGARSGADSVVEGMRKYFLGKKGHDALLPAFVALDIDKILAENMLMRSDRNTMAFSVEQRVPFLDHSFAEFVFSIPPGLKLRGGVDKYILRRAVARMLPKGTVRRSKSRFFVPIHEWFRGELGEIARQMLDSSPFFSRQYVDRLFRGFGDSRLYCSRQLWALLVFEVWHRMFIEGNAVSAPRATLRDFA